jgi:hypothetical protein
LDCGVNEDDETEAKHNVEVDESKRRKQRRDERVAKGSVFSWANTRRICFNSCHPNSCHYCYLPAYDIECGHCSKISGPRICVECIVDHYIDPIHRKGFDEYHSSSTVDGIRLFPSADDPNRPPKWYEFDRCGYCYKIICAR